MIRFPISDRSRRRAAGVSLVSLVVVCGALPAHAERGPTSPRRDMAEQCTLPTTDIAGAVTLNPACIYTQALEIRDSNTTLDCAGAVLRPNEGYAVSIKGAISDVIVRNCYVEGGNGIAVRPPGRRDGETDDDLRARAPRRVVLTNLHVSRSDNVGVYLHQYTAGVVVQRSVIVDNSSAGIYLAPHGVGHIISDNRIADNGHTKPDGGLRLGWYRREGIAVDGSSMNVIEDNDVEGNALGGVLLYKNCQEHADENPNSLPRTMHASDNVIRGNRFADQPFGVWIASRQSRDLSQMGCGDPTPYDNPIWTADVYHPTYADYPSAYVTFELPFVSVWPDFAEDTVVEANTFERISLGGVRVEDDRARVIGNLFIGTFDYIFVGAPFRARLAGHPVRETRIADNSWGDVSAAAFADRLALIPDEHEGTVLENNRRACADGQGIWLRHGARVPGGQGVERVCDDGVIRVVSGDSPPPVDDTDAGDVDPDAPSDAGGPGTSSGAEEDMAAGGPDDDPGNSADADSSAADGDGEAGDEGTPGAPLPPPPSVSADDEMDDREHVLGEHATSCGAVGTPLPLAGLLVVLGLRRRHRRA